MTNEAFLTVLEHRIRQMRLVLDRKGAEYATGRDRLHNFKRSAGVMGKSPYEACAAFMTKHLTSIFDLVDQAAAGATIPPAVVDEKIGDAVNYLVLLEALFREDKAGGQ